MNETVLADLWALVWRAHWPVSAHRWAYVLTDDDVIRLGAVLDKWCGYEPGSNMWTLDAMGGRLCFAFRVGIPDGQSEAILLFGKEGVMPLYVVPAGWPGDPPGLVGWTAEQRTTLRYAHARHVKAYELDRATAIHGRNYRALAAGCGSLEVAVTTARKYMERRDGRWRFVLPGA